MFKSANKKFINSDIGRIKGGYVNCTFSGVCFSKRDLNSTKFENCKFYGCIFESMHMLRVGFEDCKFMECGFESSRLENCNMKDCSFNDCSFESTHVLRSQFENCNISGSDLHNAFFCDSFVQVRLIDCTSVGYSTFSLCDGFVSSDCDAIRDAKVNGDRLMINCYDLKEAV